MAKIYGLQGVMTGKLANSVMAVRNGEQIARAYQPVVYNPNTPGQVAARARLKLMSQLAAVMAPFIAIRREGAISSRNLFTKKNYGLSSYNNDEASIILSGIQLTNSVVGFPSITATRDSVDTSTVNVQTNWPLGNVSRVVYVAFTKGPDSHLRAMSSAVVNESGSNRLWQGSLVVDTEPALILAYGVRDNTEAARVVFGNLIAPTSEDIAKIITSRAITEADITLTETSGFELTAAD